MSVSSIAKHTKKSKDSIIHVIHWYLDHPPKPNPKPNSNCHLIIDGTWFKRENCLVAYWDPDLERIQWWRYTIGERDFEIIEDLMKLKKAGVILASVTSDGSPAIKRAVNLTYPDVPHQRCTTHLQRQSLAWITQNPRTEAGREIRPLAVEIPHIKSFEQRDMWISDFENWCAKWKLFLKEKSFAEDESGKWWYTHKQLRRVRSYIRNAIPNLLHYLDDKTIPKNTNGLEGRFSSLKQHYRQHRGLSKARREGYIAWYISRIVNHDPPTRRPY